VIRAAALVVGLTAAGCALGPNYRRPSTPMTERFRGQARAEASSFADLPWWEVFRDPALTALIKEALDNNFDLKQAAARVEVARANARIGTTALLPSLGVEGGPSYQQIFSPFRAAGAATGFGTGPLRFPLYRLEATLSWEIDLWGRLRRLRESALAEFFASEENRRGVIVALIGDIASTYFNLVALDDQLAIARRTVEARRETVELFATREAGGVGNRLETAAAEANLANAAAAVPELERRIAQTENQLSLLVGRPPGPIRRAPSLVRTIVPPDQPAGAPAALLERRPDVRAAEARLVSANAQVGAAFASFFPTITLNASGGSTATSIGDLFSMSTLTYAVGLALGWVAPLLNGYQLVWRYRASKSNRQIAVVEYQRTVLVALVEVASALVAVDRLRERRAQLEAEVAARAESVELAKVRFRNGVASYLEVVQLEQNLFPAQILLAEVIGDQFAAYAQLYRALGGGWRR
jgi:multidrug efflux system outer membrane protein